MRRAAGGAHSSAPLLLSLLLLLAAAAATAAASAVCPPPNFDSVKGFDIKRYISQPWFIQQQMPNAYQPVSELFCVRAVYKPNASDLNKGLQVINSARSGSTSGPVVGSAGSGAAASNSGRTGAAMSLVAFPETELAADGSSSSSSPTGASKLRVGPAFLAPQFLAGNRAVFGPYWVVAASDDYSWAIVSAGPPKTATKDGCVVGPLNPGPADVNNSGLWLFSRKPVDPASTTIMRAKAKELGYDLSVLRDVKQEGCSYPDISTSSTSTQAASGAGSAEKGAQAASGGSGSSSG